MTYDKASFLAGLRTGLALPRSPKLNPDLTFKSEDGSEFILGAYSHKTWDGTIYYSTDRVIWNVWNGWTNLYSHNGVLYLRGSGNSVITGDAGHEYRWALAGKQIQCIGNIECLFDWETVKAGRHPRIDIGCCANMFYECTSLITPPAIPFPTATYSCCEFMFEGCTNLISLPSLSATTIHSLSYYMMFRGCTRIKLSTSQSATYQYPYRIPTSGTGITGDYAPLYGMFFDTGGPFTGTPEVNTTYYTDHPPIPAE